MKLSKGFTLIELLVVISIIGLLSSVVMASVNTARGNAVDSKLIQQARQISILLELENSENNTYANLNIGGWRGPVNILNNPRLCDDTSLDYGGNYGAQVTNICKDIVVTSQTIRPNSAGLAMWIGGKDLNPGQDLKKYSIKIYLPGESKKANADRYYCLGSNGRSSFGISATWSSPGCFQDPTL